MPDQAQILWRRLDEPGHELAWLRERDGEPLLVGTAVFAHAGEPCRLDYRVRCRADWSTRDACVRGWIGRRRVRLRIRSDGAGRWHLDDREVGAVEGCADVDLNFTPSTNLLPIRRLRLAVGAEAEARAAWLRFPELALEPLDQIYRRTDPSRYRYLSGDGEFSAELEVDDTGFVRRYGDLWVAEASS